MAPWLGKLKPWTAKEASEREKDIREMFETYGEYADSWLQRETGDPNLVIWDFTPKELDAIVKFCVKRGQTNAIVARAVDMAMEGRTDIDFAVIMVGKGLQTGFELNKARARKKAGMLR